jgi:hypothetical protein
VKFIIMQFSPRSIFLPFRSKYPLHHSEEDIWTLYTYDRCPVLAVWWHERKEELDIKKVTKKEVTSF